MTRGTSVAVGTAAVAALFLVQGAVRAGDEAPGRPLEKKRRVEVVRDLVWGAHLGVTLEDGEEPGAVIKDVQPDTPAARAGLQAGDVVVRYQGERVESAAALTRMVRETPAGRRVEMDVNRNGSVQRLSATLEKGGGMHRWAEGLRGLEDLDIELPAMPPMPDIPPVPPIPPVAREFEGGDFRRLLRESGGARKLGIQYQEVSGQLARYFKLSENVGILVSEVDADGPAAKAGLRAGDVILKFNGSAVTDSRSFREQVRKADPGSDATLTVSREGRSLDLTVKLGGTAPARRPGRTT
jgi:S1-C subfamily serine protease